MPSLFISVLNVQFATLARMLQADPPPKAVKVTVSKRVPLVGDELIAYEEEQNRIKEEALKASMIKEEELKASRDSDTAADPMVIDAGNSNISSEGRLSFLLHSFFKYLRRVYIINISWLSQIVLSK